MVLSGLLFQIEITEGFVEGHGSLSLDGPCAISPLVVLLTRKVSSEAGSPLNQDWEFLDFLLVMELAFAL